MNRPASDFVVRPLTATDRPQWGLLWGGYNAFYGRSGVTALAPAITESTWSRFFDPDEPVFGLGAHGPDGLLGLVHFLYHRSTTQIAPTCYLQDLFTSEVARGKGVGRALIEAVCARARGDGVPRVYWQTHETNQNAMRLYDQIATRPGFVLYSHYV